MTLIGLAVLLVEGGRANAAGGPRRGRQRAGVRWLRKVSLTGAFLLGLSTFQAEFDFGVPQFRFVFAPMLVMLAAGVALVAARVWLGRGAALGAALFFLAVRGGIAADRRARSSARRTPHFPLYLPAALIGRAGRAARQPDRPLRFGARRRRRHRHRRPRRRVGLVAGLHADPMAVRAAARGRRARLRDGDRRRRCWAPGWAPGWRPTGSRGPPLAAAGRRRRRGGRRRAGPLRAAEARRRGRPRHDLDRRGASTARTARASSTGAARPARGRRRTPSGSRRSRGRAAGWCSTTCAPTGEPGTYETSRPVPLDGDWKTLVRLHDGNSLTGAPGLPARRHGDPGRRRSPRPTARRASSSPTTRSCSASSRPPRPACGRSPTRVVLAITLSFLALIAWGLHRLAVTAEEPPSAGATGARQAQRRRAGESAARSERPDERRCCRSPTTATRSRRCRSWRRCS